MDKYKLLAIINIMLLQLLQIKNSGQFVILTQSDELIASYTEQQQYLGSTTRQNLGNFKWEKGNEDE